MAENEIGSVNDKLKILANNVNDQLKTPQNNYRPPWATSGPNVCKLFPQHHFI